MKKPNFNNFIKKHFNKKTILKAINNLFSKTQYKIIFGVIFTLFFSFFLTIFIFKFYFDYDSLQGMRIFTIKKNSVFYISYLIILLLVSLTVSIIGKFGVSYIVVSLTILILLSASHAKFDSRNMPLLPEDLKLALTGLKMANVVNQKTIVKIVLSVITLISFSCGLFVFIKNSTHYPKNKKILYPARLAIVLVCLFGLSEINYNFKQSVKENNWSYLTRTSFVSWNQYKNYHKNGPVAGFMYNVGGLELSKPDNYSKKTVKEVVEKYKRQAQTININKKSLEDQKVDIIYILSESLIDPFDFKDKYNVKKDPMPYTRDLMNRISSGRLATSEYGGGTANVEFEILTGFTNMLTENTTPYTHSLPKKNNFPSMASQLKKAGFKTTSLHAFDREMYKRNITYPVLGFDDFIGDKRMNKNKPIKGNQYISDRDFYDEIILQLDNEPEKNHFIHGVSMQNHAPYINLYPDDKNIWIDNDSNDPKIDQLNNYLKGVSYSDVFLKEFIEKLQQRSKPTIVVLWGDHIPGHSIMRKVDSEKTEGHKTPLFIYTNFKTKKKNLNLMSGNFINNQVLDILNSRISPFQLLLLDLQKYYPAMTIYHIEDKKTLTENPIFKDYKLIQYDLLAGKKYAEKYGFFNTNVLNLSHGKEQK